MATQNNTAEQTDVVAYMNRLGQAARDAAGAVASAPTGAKNAALEAIARCLEEDQRPQNSNSSPKQPARSAPRQQAEHHCKALPKCRRQCTASEHHKHVETFANMP